MSGAALSLLRAPQNAAPPTNRQNRRGGAVGKCQASMQQYSSIQAHPQNIPGSKVQLSAARCSAAPTHRLENVGKAQHTQTYDYSAASGSLPRGAPPCRRSHPSPLTHLRHPPHHRPSSRALRDEDPAREALSPPSTLRCTSRDNRVFEIIATKIEILEGGGSVEYLFGDNREFSRYSRGSRDYLANRNLDFGR